MNNLESFNFSTKKHCDYCRQMIAGHTPPKSENDERMIRHYQRLLNRDRLFLHNLELLKLKEAMRMDTMNKMPCLSHSISELSASLNLDELRALLDETYELIN